MNMKYRWEIIPMEGESIFILTDEDSIIEAASLYAEHYACFESVYAIRKAEEIKAYREAV